MPIKHLDISWNLVMVSVYLFSFFSPSLLVVLFKMFPFDIVSACYCGPLSLSLLVVLNQCLCNIYVDVFVLISVTFAPIMKYTRFWLSI